MGKIILSFTGTTPPPANGYHVTYRKQVDVTYQTVTPNPTSSPVVISGLENGVNYLVYIGSDCGEGSTSELVVVNANATKSFLTCPANMTDNTSSSSIYTYPDKYIDLFNNPSTQLQLNYNAYDRPNRFTIYDENGNLVISSGWVGTASYSGPWGVSLNVSPIGQLNFNRDPAITYYTLRVEAGPANPENPISDNWEAQFSCS